LIIINVFKRQSVKYANPNGLNFGTCQNDGTHSVYNSTH